MRSRHSPKRPLLEEFEPRVMLSAILTVNGTGDAVAPDGELTLREAILVANGSLAIDSLSTIERDLVVGTPSHGLTANRDEIRFSIPGTGVHTITPLVSLPAILDPVSIDGYTQPGASPNTLAVGDNAVLLIELNGAVMALNGSNAQVGQRVGLGIGGAGSLVRGLVINRFEEAGLKIDTSWNRIEGNFIGTDPTGEIARPNGDGITILPLNVHYNTIGGASPAARNLVSGNSNVGSTFGAGVGILILGASFSSSDGNVIQGNYIGTNAAGTAALGNRTTGIQFNVGTGNLVGGAGAGEGNLISGNGGDGILIGTTGGRAPHGNVVQGNFIGTDASGIVPLGNVGNGRDGVFLGGITPATFGNTIGGTAAGAGNIIAFNGRAGISVSSGNGHALLSNSIHSNAGQGIDLNGDGNVTPNDPGDGDVGNNDLQNVPVLTSVTGTGGGTTIAGSLDSTPDTTFRIEFFANDAADSSGSGEGQTFLGFATVTTDNQGFASFAAALTAIVAPGQTVSATATSAAGNTSEFSQALLNSPDPSADLSVTVIGTPDPVAVGNALTYTIVVTNAGPGEARSVLLVNALPSGVTYVSATGGVTPDANALRFPLGDLAPGSSVTLTVVVRPTSVAAGTTIVATATVSGTSDDSQIANNTATIRVVVQDPAPNAIADLSVTILGAPASPAVGQNLTYTVTVSNAGPSIATDVMLADTLPIGVRLVSAEVSQGTFALRDEILISASLGDLRPGASATLRIVVAAMAPGDLRSSVRMTGAEADPDVANNSGELVVTVPQPTRVPTAPAIKANWVSNTGLPGSDGFILVEPAEFYKNVDARFNFYRGTRPDQPLALIATGQSGPLYRDLIPSTSAAQTFYYQVARVVEGVEGTRSDVASATIPAIEAPAPPMIKASWSIGAGKPGGNGLVLVEPASFYKEIGATFNVYRSLRPGQPLTLLAKEQTTTSHTDVIPRSRTAQTVTYQISAVVRGVEGTRSNVARAVVPAGLYVARIAAITTLYSRLLNRAPEPEALRALTGRLEAKVPLAKIARTIVQSPEYHTLHKGTKINRRTSLDLATRAAAKNYYAFAQPPGIEEVLANILFPVFEQARRKARLVSELSHAKLLTLAILLYEEDHESRLPEDINLTSPYHRSTDLVQYAVGNRYHDEYADWNYLYPPFSPTGGGTFNGTLGSLADPSTTILIAGKYRGTGPDAYIVGYANGRAGQLTALPPGLHLIL